MPELLLELFSEEIPARFQRRAAEDLKKAVTNALVDAGLVYEGAKAFATPRRLALTVTGLPARSPDIREEKKGPRVGAPQPAIDGFLKAAGLTSIDQAKIESDPKKGEFYVAHIERKGAPAPDILATLLPKVVSGFDWAKSMRWGAGSLNWVRPLRAVTATFGTENDEPIVIPFEAGTLRSGQTTYGHRFLAPAAIRVKRFDDYVRALEKAKVVLDLDRRKQIIKTDTEHLAFAQGLTVIHDEGLLEEVAGLVEWPVAMLGAFDESFLDLPEEVIIATIRANQKCFCLRDARGRLANKFILTANNVAADGGATITAGNERVIRARLSDAKFFYEHDLAIPLEAGLPKLKDAIFHQKLGTQFERVERLVALAGEIAPLVGADVEEAKLAASLAKADLVTFMVGEFPELQGLMGHYYALAQGRSGAIANAVKDHYKPLGPTDMVPAEPVAIAVALADKLDLLTGFWAIDEKPTGSRDPFALRRAALGVIRIVVENGLRLPLRDIFAFAYERVVRNPSFALRLFYRDQAGVMGADGLWENPAGWSHTDEGGETRIYSDDWNLDFAKEIRCFNQAERFVEDLDFLRVGGVNANEAKLLSDSFTLGIGVEVGAGVLAFFHDRLKVTLREQGARHDLVDAVITKDSDDILQITQRVEALSSLLDSEDGRNLLAGYRRAVNIVSIEEKKDGKTYDGSFTIKEGLPAQEFDLRAAIEGVAFQVRGFIDEDKYGEAIWSLATLRPFIDAFFESVLVNDPDPAIRANRLNLLARLRDTMHLVADFSKVAG